MSPSLTTKSLKDTLRFPFRTEGWEGRFLVGAGLILGSFVVPIIPALLVGGYILLVFRQTIAGEEPSLPAWDDWGKLFTDGLRWFAVTLAYLGPGTLLLLGGYAGYFAATFVPVFSAGGRGSEAVAIAVLFGMACLFIGLFLGMLLLIIGAVPLPIAVAHFVAKDKVGAAFRVREWWAIARANGFGFLVAWIVSLGLYSLWGLATALLYYSCVLCVLVPFVSAVAGFYLGLVAAALFGQAYREGVQALEDRESTASAETA
ncbi:MAG: DUF4013 domain-containing protein [Anaerolineae bacterium]